MLSVLLRWAWVWSVGCCALREGLASNLLFASRAAGWSTIHALFLATFSLLVAFCCFIATTNKATQRITLYSFLITHRNCSSLDSRVVLFFFILEFYSSSSSSSLSLLLLVYLSRAAKSPPTVSGREGTCWLGASLEIVLRMKKVTTNDFSFPSNLLFNSVLVLLAYLYSFIFLVS